MSEEVERIKKRLRMKGKINVEEMADNLIAWSLKDDSWNLCGFVAQEAITAQRVSEWARNNDYFKSAYDFALSQLGQRRERKVSDGSLHTVGYKMNGNVYDAFLKEEDYGKIKFEARLKKELDSEGKNPINDKYLEELDKTSKLSYANYQQAKEIKELKEKLEALEAKLGS